ncbi:MAG: hypothetical protein K2V38_03530, partial [Gemmataceae bacterium]|nr:hypothetical protein [Gemmataceae bacterium]
TLIDAIVEKGRVQYPDKIRFATYTLRYDRGPGITVHALEKHWARASVESDRTGNAVTVKTENVAGFTLWVGNAEEGRFVVTIDGTELNVRVPKKGAGNPNGWPFWKVDGKWVNKRETSQADQLRKRHGLQGPIDDAFMSSFVMVKPGGRPMNSKTADWAEAEMKHAITHWRSQFRGDAVVKGDNEVTKEDIANSNLILWGDPMSNAYIGKIIDKLPIKWTAEGVKVGKDLYEHGKHMPVLIYPNPLNPAKYVVINSGFTFREYDYLNNARQVPKLPDYAVIDITTPPNARYPGKVVRAGFFGEKWELQDNDGK